MRGGCLFDDHWTPNWGAFRLPNTGALKKHWEGVLNHIRTWIDNGILEGRNSLFKAAPEDTVPPLMWL